MNPNNTSPKPTTVCSSRGIVKARRSFSPDLTTNYALMLRLYLINKEQKVSKKELKYFNTTRTKKADKTKASSSTAWNNIVQVIQKANQLIAHLSTPKIEMVTK